MNAEPQDPQAARSPVPAEKYKLEEHRFRPLQPLSFEDWSDAGDALQTIDGNIRFWLGDWYLYGEEQFGEEAAQAVPDDPRSAKTISNAVAIMSRIPPERRRPEASWSIHAEVAYLDAPDQVRWLETAIAEQLTVRKLRDRIRMEKQSIDVEPLPEPRGDKPDPPPAPSRPGALENVLANIEDCRPSELAESVRDDPIGRSTLRRFCVDTVTAIDKLHSEVADEVEEAFDELESILDAGDLERATEEFSGLAERLNDPRRGLSLVADDSE